LADDRALLFGNALPVLMRLRPDVDPTGDAG
jgi:hypothetical protein